MTHARVVKELFLEVAANPADLGRRLVLADLLLERGDRRGELIALQCAHSPTPAQSMRARELLAANVDRWVSREVLRVVDCDSLVFDRGFLVACRVSVPSRGEASLLPLDWSTVRRIHHPTAQLVGACPVASELLEVDEGAAVGLWDGPPLLRFAASRSSRT